VVERAPKPAAAPPKNPQPPTVLDRAPPEASKPTAPKPAAPKAPEKPAAPTVFEKAPPKAPAAAPKPAAPTLFEKPSAKPPAAPPKEAAPTVFEKGPGKPAAAPPKAPPTVFEKKDTAKPAASAPTPFEKSSAKEPVDDLPELGGLDDLEPLDEAPAPLDLGDFEEPAKPVAKPEKPAAKPAPAAATLFDPSPAKSAPAGKPAKSEHGKPAEPNKPAPAASSIIDDEEEAKPTPASAGKAGARLGKGALIDVGLAVAAAGLAALAWLGTDRPPLARPVASATIGAAPSASFKVEIDAQNVVKVNGSAVAPEAVAAALESAGAPQQVLIQASGDALYGTIERVISAAGRGGAVSVQLATHE
jgi:biopolymer transport protein ExbD